MNNKATARAIIADEMDRINTALGRARKLADELATMGINVRPGPDKLDELLADVKKIRKDTSK